MTIYEINGSNYLELTDLIFKIHTKYLNFNIAVLLYITIEKSWSISVNISMRKICFTGNTELMFGNADAHSERTN